MKNAEKSENIAIGPLAIPRTGSVPSADSLERSPGNWGHDVEVVKPIMSYHTE
jgi:hypothetical protein